MTASLPTHWLFLRGLAREQRHWGSFLPLFERLVPGVRAYGLDLPGAGTELRRASPTTLRGIVADVRFRWLALRDAHVGEWGLFGMSLGGMVAMQWCSEQPRDFARVVLAGSSAGDLSPPWRRFRPSIVPTALRSMRAKDPISRETAILSMTARAHAATAAVAVEWARYPPMHRLNVVRQLRAASTFRAPRELSPPSLVLVGARDPLVHPSCSERIAARLSAPLRVHPDAGHELALDAPEWVAHEVAAWCGAPADA